MSPTDNSLSLNAFARRLGVDEKAVRKAVASGRLKDCLGSNAKGKAVVVDVALGEQEWRANAGRRRAGDGNERPDSLAEAQRKVAIERAKALKLANRQKRGALISVTVARREAFEAGRILREALLNLPDRISAELAAEHDAGRIHARLSNELRAALESAATKVARAS